ncbi:unnamed protein product [Lactuca virosa]|uniref:Uncharacterized protein n=1 Tax=Lactuca virosa TaxID=75947 RepID=A0AAU9P7N9_9ASTR|nr:unnamed protein product [Lactuca virosa]
MIVDSEEEPTKDGDDTEPEYTLTEHPSEPDYTPADHFSSEPSEPVHSPVYTPAGFDLLISDYDPDEDKKDTAISLEISPPRLTHSHRYFSAHTTGTRVKQTAGKTTTIPSRKRAAPPSASPPPSKKPCGDYTWMPYIRALK